MVTKDFTINLETRRTVGTATPIVVEGDTGNVFKIVLTDEGTPIDLTDCRVVAIFANNAGTFAQDSALVNGGITIGGDDDNEITLNLFSGSYSKGTNTCQIQVYSGVDFSTLITTADFTFEARSPLLNDNTIASDNNFPVLVGLISQVEALADREQADWTEADDMLSSYIQNKPTIPSTPGEVGAAAAAHALQHAFTGADPLTPDAIGAPTKTDFEAHASRHAAGGADPIVHTWTRTLTAAGWSENTQDLLLPITDDNVVFIQGGTDDDKAAFAGISVAHIAEGLRFTAVSTPTVDITLNISAI